MDTITDISVGVIGACYYVRPARFERLARKFLTTMTLGVRERFIRFVSMRSAPFVHADLSNSTSWLENGGRIMDISAYATAARSVGDADLYVLFNDTLFIKHPWRHISRRLRSVMESVSTTQVPAAGGEVHLSTDLLLFDPTNPTRRHLSTFCFLLNRPAFSIFTELAATLPEGDSNDGISEWLEGHMVNCLPLRHLLHVHLMGPLSPWSWKGTFVARAPRALLLRKAVAVTFEYMFSQQLLRRGGVVMPINLGLNYKMRAKMALIGARIFK